MKLSSANARKNSKSNKGNIKIAYNTGPRMDPCTVARSRSNNTDLTPSILT
jgi:hypothetical protein